ncbi:MAG: guanylate kinase [Desulfobacterales bacterium]|jgi:guanylate kinase|nr:guanylate kinase [Desulfobacterales bacterium]
MRPNKEEIPERGAEAERRAPPRPGLIFILSAPSGAGKTTLRQALLGVFPDILFSVSFTTRAPREGEVNGRDYVFVPVAEFEAGIRSGRWAEWAQVHGNFYGTSAEVLEQARAAGRDVLLEIDVQGARQICARFPECVTIFIRPPSLEALRQRLVARGTDSPEAIARRLENAAGEMAQIGFYRHVIVNDDLPAAVRDLVAVVGACRGGPARSAGAQGAA